MGSRKTGDQGKCGLGHFMSTKPVQAGHPHKFAARRGQLPGLCPAAWRCLALARSYIGPAVGNYRLTTASQTALQSQYD